MSTLAGHSDLHALQARQRSRDFFYFVVLPAVSDDFALEHLEEHVGAAAGAVLFFQGDHVAGAHGSVIYFAAGSEADAALGGFGEGAAVVDEFEDGLWFRRSVVHAQAQVFGGQVGVEDLMRVHRVGGVPDGFELVEGLHEFGAEHLGQQGAAGLAITVFSGEGAAVADDEVGGAIDEFSVVADSFFGLEVEVDAHVDAAVTEVSVEGAGVVVLVEEGADVAQISA